MEPKPDKKTARRKAAPFALAAYDMAREDGNVDDWELKLQQITEVLSDPELKKIPHDPRLDQAALKKVMETMLDKLEATELQRAFVNLLIEEKKLSLMPYVYEGFRQERKKAEGRVDVTVVSAIPLTEAQVRNLKETLKTRFNVKAEPEMKVDPDLIGGLKIVIGDRVYDQTIKGQLERLRKHLDRPGP